jgi:[FeFe] hydrogenase H-cluster maturation GTPase HydF
MKTTPKSNRLHIAIFGRRNSGKSSLLNALTRQNVSIVSDVPGTTTDPVEKPMELLPLGPVLFIDTAGIDDVGALGALRVEKTRRVFDRADVAMVVAAGGEWGEFEESLLAAAKERGTPAVAIFNKTDLGRPPASLVNQLQAAGIRVAHTTAVTGEGILDLREAIVEIAPADCLQPPSLAGDLTAPGELAVLVVPIDMEAPKGRLILPQVQTIRDLLDCDAYCMIVKERELRDALARLNRPPALVVTDSQAFLKVAAETPRSVKLTSFSILFARAKGDLDEFVRGAMAIERLAPGDRVLICEACTHHPLGDDIGRVKIPRWLRQYVGGSLEVIHRQGHDFSERLDDVQLVIHCGACMHNRKQMLSRILRCRRAGVPITNYGMAIAYTLGILERALEPFPSALETYRVLASQSPT